MTAGHARPVHGDPRWDVSVGAVPPKTRLPVHASSRLRVPAGQNGGDQGETDGEDGGDEGAILRDQGALF